MHIANIDDQITLPQDRQLLALYRKAARHGSLPHISLLTAEVMHELGDDLTVVERNVRGEFDYLYFGEAIRDATGSDYKGLTTAHQPPKSGAQARRSFINALDAMAPVFSIDRAAENGRVHLWGRLHLPFRDSEGRTLVVTVNRPREYTDDLLREILDAAADGIIAVRAIRNAEGDVVDCAIIAANAPMVDFLQVDTQTLTSTTILTLFPFIRQNGIWDTHLSVIESRNCRTFESRQNVGGCVRWYRVVSAPLNDGLVISYTDITELKQLNLELEQKRKLLEEEMARRALIEEELWTLAKLDPLTGLANRRYMQEHAMATLMLAQKNGVTCTLIELDIDFFKKINDTHGHAAGDRAICAVAEAARSGLRDSHDMVARIGGEEFAMLLYDAGVEAGMGVAERLRQKIEAMDIIAGDKKFGLTVSFGVSISTPDSTYESLLHSADQALYRAKRAGRNQAILEDPAVAA